MGFDRSVQNSLLVDADGNPIPLRDADTVTPATQGVMPVAGVDGTTARTLRVDAGGRAKVQADALPLPAGAATEVTLATMATEAKLEAVRALLASLDAKDFATQTTLATLATQATASAIQTVLEAIRDTAGIKKITDVVNTVIGAGSALMGKVTINDGTYDATCTSDNRLRVEEAPPSTPPGQTEFSGTSVGTLSSGDWDNYDIPIGETLTLQRFTAGCAGEGGKGALVYIAYDQTGGDPFQNSEIIRAYVNSSSVSFPVTWTAPRAAVSGDRIRIRREPLEGSTQEIYGQFVGYY